MDGFEWTVLEPLLRAGQMPHLAALMDRGTYGVLATQTPALSPRLWATIATGKPPEQHGILNFVVAAKEGGRTRITTSRDRKTKAFWNILTDAGISSDTIGWWNTYPVEPVRGLMVAQTNTENQAGLRKGRLERAAGNQVWPPEAEEWVFACAREASAALPELTREIFGAFGEPLHGEAQQRWKQCRWAFRADATYVAVLQQRTRIDAPARVTSLYLGGTDIVGHRFWAAHDPESFGLSADSHEVRTFGHVVESYYRYVDRVLGDVLARFPSDTVVFLVADHGMGPHRSEEEGHAGLDFSTFTGVHDGDDPGFFVAAGPGIQRTGAGTRGDAGSGELPVLGSIADFTPTLLTLVGVPYGEDMSGRPMRSVLSPSFLERSPPSTVPTHDTAGWRARRPEAPVVEDPERIEQLKNLGYLRDDP